MRDRLDQIESLIQLQDRIIDRHVLNLILEELTWLRSQADKLNGADKLSEGK